MSDIEFPNIHPTAADLEPIYERLKSTLTALKAHPLRAEYVTTLLIPTFGPLGSHISQTETIHALIDLVKPHLTTLAITTEEVGRQIFPSPELEHLFLTYDSWPKLRSFRVSTGNAKDLLSIACFLGKCPRITNFELNWTRSLGDPPLETRTGVLKSNEIPALPTLTHFATTNFTDRYILPRMFMKMPNLTDLTLHGIFEDNEYDLDVGIDRFFDALKGLKKLETIHWLTMDMTFEFPTRITGMQSLRAYSEVMEEYDAETDELELIVSGQYIVVRPAEILMCRERKTWS